MADCIRRWTQPHIESRTVNLLNELLIGILDALTQQQTDQDPELTSRHRTVELFLRDLANPASASCCEPWTLGRMAEHCGMGITCFTKYCRDLVNTGAVEYLNQCRLERAARLILKKSERSITEIAFESGFNSSQYFATAFRKQYKTTPSVYRRLAGRNAQPLWAKPRQSSISV